MTLYRTIVADPPWPYTGDVRGTRQPKLNGQPSLGVGIADRYNGMSIDSIAALRPASEDDAHLYLWTTNAFMDEAYDVARAWGFQPKTICTWGKVQPDGRPSMKTGYYFRGATEHVLFCVRGSLPLEIKEGVPTLWLWPRLGHSIKPDAFYDLVERCSPGPRLELFARRARFGWDYWGDESLGTASFGEEHVARLEREANSEAMPQRGDASGRADGRTWTSAPSVATDAPRCTCIHGASGSHNESCPNFDPELEAEANRG